MAPGEKDLEKTRGDFFLFFCWMLSGCVCSVHMKRGIINSELIRGTLPAEGASCMCNPSPQKAYQKN